MPTGKEFWKQSGAKEKKGYILKERDFYLVFFSSVISSLSSFFLNTADMNTHPLFKITFLNYVATAVLIVFIIIILAVFAISIFRFLNRLGTFFGLIWKELKIFDKK